MMDTTTEHPEDLTPHTADATDAVDPFAQLKQALDLPKPPLSADMLTPLVLASVASKGSNLYGLLSQAGLNVIAYGEACRQIHAYIETHPEQVDVVRLIGGDESDLETALLAQWFDTQLAARRAQTEAETQTAQAVSDGCTPDDTPTNMVSLTSRRRASGTRKRAHRRTAE